MSLLGFSPSHANRWMPCGGSVALSQPYLSQPQEDSESRLEGIAAHWVAEQLFRKHVVKLGSQAPNGVIVNEEMLDAASEYVALLSANAQLEMKVDLGVLTSGMTAVIDACWREDRTAHVWDFKYGHGFVDEFENWQLLTEVASFDWDDLGVDTIEFHIFQPRCYQAESHRMWALEVGEYMEHYLPKIKMQVQSIAAGKAGCTSGKHCKNCPAAASCDTLAQTSYDLVDRSKQATSTELTSDQLARELDVLHAAQERIKARVVGLEEQASATLKKGGRVPGYTLTPQKGRLDWIAPHETVIAMARMNGLEIQKPVAAITPTQAKKLGMSEAIVDSLSKAPDKAAKLTRVDSNQARKAFKK